MHKRATDYSLFLHTNFFWIIFFVYCYKLHICTFSRYIFISLKFDTFQFRTKRHFLIK
nr:MAG TPA_asm: hypothetical protein [Bacteriophage sp.]